jgi:hypothetical protein
MRLIRKWHVPDAITDSDNKIKYLNEFDQKLIVEISKYRNILVECLDLQEYDRFNT